MKKKYIAPITNFVKVAGDDILQHNFQLGSRLVNASEVDAKRVDDFDFDFDNTFDNYLDEDFEKLVGYNNNFYM